LAVHAEAETRPAQKVSTAIKKPIASKTVAKKPAAKKGGRK
jgi:hypothetical protein